MKKLIIIFALAALVGCTTTPPKTHTPVTQSARIILNDYSSEPLKLMDSVGATGVRDLTVKEFKRTAKDREKFEKNIGSNEGFNRAAYEAGGIGLGLSGGIGLGSVLGFAALTSLTADDSPDNYVFSWDFDGKARVYNQQGIVDYELLNTAIKKGLEDFTETYPEIFQQVREYRFTEKPEGDGYLNQKGNVVKVWHYNEKKKRRRVDAEAYYFIAGNSAPLPKGRTLYFSTVSYCSGETNGCALRARADNVNKPMAITTTIYRAIAANLPSDYFIYLPPDKALYRLPMIVYGESSAIGFLVEKEGAPKK